MDLEKIHKESNTIYLKKHSLEYLLNKDNIRVSNNDIFQEELNVNINMQ